MYGVTITAAAVVHCFSESTVSIAYCINIHMFQLTAETKSCGMSDIVVYKSNCQNLVSLGV